MTLGLETPAREERWRLDGVLGDSEASRWWSRSRQLLTPGEHTHEVALDRTLWTGGGTQEQAAFDRARQYVENVGFTLSDNQSAGHGVCMKAGAASVTVKAFAVG